MAFFSFSQLPQFDTLHTQVYVLNCPVLGGGIGNGSYAELVVNLQNIRSQLLTEDWYVEVAVETPNTSVELVNSATDWGPRLQLVGTFREIDPLADYTLKYDVFDKPGQGLRTTMSAKVEDSVALLWLLVCLVFAPRSTTVACCIAKCALVGTTAP